MPGNTAHKRTVAQREADLIEFAKLWRQGMTEWGMVAWVKQNRVGLYTLSRSMIHIDIVEIKSRWRQQASASVGDRIAEQLASIDAQEQSAWKAWHASVGEIKEVTKEAIEGGTGADKRIKAVVKTHTSPGDPRYLSIIQGCVEARNRLLGLAKNKIEISGPNGAPVAMAVQKESDLDMAAIDKFLESEYAKRFAAQPKPATEG